MWNAGASCPQSGTTLNHTGSFPGSRSVKPCKIIFVPAPVDTFGLVPTGSLISVRKISSSGNCGFHQVGSHIGWWRVNSLLCVLVLISLTENRFGTHLWHQNLASTSFHFCVPLKVIFFVCLTWTVSLESGRVASLPLQPLRP